VTKARPVGLAIAVAGMLCASGAGAQEPENPIGGRSRKSESPQNFAAEIRFAPFYPAIDSDPQLHGQPFKDFFGTAPRLLVSAEFDWQAYRIPHVGTIGPGFGLGFSTMSDPAQFQQEHNGTTESGETGTLQIVPCYLAAVLRIDVLWRQARVPIVPYAKAGLALAFWRASNTLGTSRADGVLGEGESLGTHVALGIAVNLNPLDAYAATSFDDAMGVNNTYVFAEWTREDLDGLGIQSDPLRVGGTAWNFGLAFEF